MKSFKQYFIEKSENFNKKYPIAKSKVDGRSVMNEVPNMNSISATFYDYTILPKVREVKMKFFGGPRTVFYAKDDFDKSRNLAETIKESKKISPLIIAVDKEGPYILEGSHRFVALYYLNAKSFPAIVVIDEDD